MQNTSQLNVWVVVSMQGMLDSVKHSCGMALQECSASDCCGVTSVSGVMPYAACKMNGCSVYAHSI